MEILNSILEILLGGFTQTATGMGSGLGQFVQQIFLTNAGNGDLSVFGTLVVCFAGIGLALGLCYWVINWLTSFGN